MTEPQPNFINKEKTTLGSILYDKGLSGRQEKLQSNRIYDVTPTSMSLGQLSFTTDLTELSKFE